MLINAPTLEDELMQRQMSDERIHDLAVLLEFKENKHFTLDNGLPSLSGSIIICNITG